MARTIAFQRKSAPPTPSETDDNKDEQDTPDDQSQAGDAGDDTEDAVCPNCGCQFDDDTGDVIKPGKPVQGGSDKADYAPDGKGGPDLALPGVTPDPQAPAGESAITQALAAVLAGQR